MLSINFVQELLTPPHLKEQLKLKAANEYKHLKQSDCMRLDDVDDAQRCQMLMQALDTVQIPKEDQENAFAMLAAVLWLGNIDFLVIDNENHVEVVLSEGVVNAANLLGCKVPDLMLALSTHKIRAGNDDIVQKLTLSQATDTRDALAKSIYASLFDWLVEQINKSLQMRKCHAGRSISILDIYGFESFHEYTEDGIVWTNVQFIDNTDCPNLFEKVLYDTSGFLEKNRDPLHSDSIQLLLSCSSQLPQLFASNIRRQSQKESSSFRQRSRVDSQKQCVGTKFKGQLFKLMQWLENTAPHFIRCIKPNSKQLPGMYQHDLVLEQLRCCGVLEISRSGYPTRMTHQQFAERYSFLLLENLASQDPLSVSVAVLHQFNVPPEMYQVGYTKLFFRTGQVILAAARKSLAADDMASHQGRLDASPVQHSYDLEDPISAGTCTREGTPAKQSHACDAGVMRNSNGTWSAVKHLDASDAGLIRYSNGTTQSAVSHLVKEFEQQTQVFEDDAVFLVEVKSRQSDSSINSDEELQKLKARFVTWKKDYNVRLRETKIALQKLGNPEENAQEMVGQLEDKMIGKYFSLMNVSCMAFPSMADISLVLRHEIRDDILSRKLKGSSISLPSLEEVDFIYAPSNIVYMLCCILLCAYGA